MSQTQDLTNAIMAFYKDPTKNFFRLQGSAGRGKSTSVKQMIDAFVAIRKIESVFDPEKQQVTSANLFVTATTNQAVAVLMPDMDELAKKHDMPFFVGTVHSFFCLRMINDYQTGKKKLIKNVKADPPKVLPNSLLIIDEASYGQFKVWSELHQLLALKPDLKVVLVADKRQGKVIGEGLSNFVSKVDEDFELKISFRFPEDSAINQNSKMLEQVIDGASEPSEFKEDNTFKLVSRKEAMQFFKEKAIDADEDVKYVAYRNSTINAFNKQVQAKKYGDKRFHVGQQLIAPDSQLIDQVGIVNNSKHIVTHVGSESVVHQEDKLGNTVEIETYEIRLKGHGNKLFNVPRDIDEYYRQLKQLSKAKQWFLFFKCKESVLELRPSWAITCFKSQGSTYDYTIVDLAELESIPSTDDFHRMLNVAITRSRKQTLVIED